MLLDRPRDALSVTPPEGGSGRSRPLLNAVAANLNKEQIMKLLNSVKQFLVSEDGPTAVEYAVMLALIIIVCLTAITSVGTQTNTTFEGVATAL